MMKTLTTLITILITDIITTGSALAHPGHFLDEQTHSFIDNDQLVIFLAIIIAIIVALVIERAIKKLF